ncbi:MAG: transfer Agent [Hyphomicrobiales bacterium]|nr:MAG: transfer Agent [Hyphomicrobiales bacterium]
MANKYRGEIDAKFDGRTYTLCLTLGALAELESAFEVDNLLDLTERFRQGSFRADDMIRILGAGLRGGGHCLSNDDVAEIRADGGITGIATCVSELLNATFASDEVIIPPQNAPESAPINQ